MHTFNGAHTNKNIPINLLHSFKAPSPSPPPKKTISILVTIVGFALEVKPKKK